MKGRKWYRLKKLRPFITGTSMYTQDKQCIYVFLVETYNAQ